MRRSVTTAVRLGAATLVTAAVSFFGPTCADALTAKDLPPSMHGAVETQAITAGNGALSLLVDPGTAYAYSTLDRDDYGNGSVNFSMTARGANLNLGTIAYAVLWPAPDCETRNVTCVTSGQVIYGNDESPSGYSGPPPNTGLHEAKGFPLYAEALYPPPPDGGGASQERVYKCVVTKDGPGSPPTNGAQASVCKTSDSMPMTAWAETIADEVRSTGFSRAEGFDAGALAVKGSESTSDVRAIGGGLVKSYGASNVYGISMLGGLITIDSVKSTSTIVSSTAGIDPKQTSSSCTFSGLSVAGQNFATTAGELADPGLQAALDQVAAQTGYKVEIIAPTDTDVAQVDEGKFVAGCSGLQVKFTDTHTAAPLPCSPVDPPQAPAPPDDSFPAAPYVPSCAPALGNREELSFGRISVQQAVQSLDFLGGILGGDQGLAAGGDSAVGGGDFAAAPDAGSGAGAAAGSGTVTDMGGSGLGTGSVSTGKSGKATPGRATKSLDYTPAALKRVFNPARIGAATAVAGAGLVFGVLVLIGVVNALAARRPFRLPGL